MRDAPGRASVVAAAWTGLVLASFPLAWGGLREAGAAWLGWGVAAVVTAWLAALVAERRIPAPGLPVGLAACAVALVAASWLWRDLPAPDAFTVAHAAKAEARWPESMVDQGPAAVLARAGLALVLLVVAADLGRSAAARAWVAGGVVLGAVAVGAVGLVQNRLGLEGIYGDGIRLPGAPFGPFFHHTSGGAALNLGLGIAGLAALGGLVAGRWTVALPAGLVAVGLVGAHLGHVGRTPPVIGLGVLGLAGLAVGVGAWARRRSGAAGRGGPGAGAWVVAAVMAVLVVVGLAALGGRTRETGERWRQLLGGPGAGDPARERREAPPESEWERLAGLRQDLIVGSDHRGIAFGDRGVAWAAGREAVAERPWLGWGPGGWRAASSLHADDPYVRTFYLYLQFAHQDPLQALVEWGVVGSAGWAVLLAGGAGLLAVRRRGALVDPAAGTSPLLDLGIVASLAMILLQGLGDFPLQVPAIQATAFALAGLCHGAAREG